MTQSTYNINDKTIILIGVNHIQNNLSHDYMRKIVDKANQMRKVCYLVEYDKRYTKKQVRHVATKGGDFTTRVIMPQLKREYRNIFDNICIKGWDSRQSWIGQKLQNQLYSNNVINMRMGDFESIIRKLPNKFTGNKRNYIEKDFKHLEYNFSNPEVYFNLSCYFST